MKESGGDYPQPTGVWEVDYDVILADIISKEKRKRDQIEKAVEDKERLEVLASGEGWRGVIEKFRQRELPDVRVAVDPKGGAIGVTLLKAGLRIDVQHPREDDKNGPEVWRILHRPGKTTKLETEIIQCLHERLRAWDLAYLLVSYSLIYLFYASTTSPDIP